MTAIQNIHINNKASSIVKNRNKKILFLIGSYNQTTQMHQIASRLPEYDCYFSQFYSDNSVVKMAIASGLLESTILSGQFKKNADEYLKQNKLKNDYEMKRYSNTYDLVVVCSDLLLPKSLRKIKTIWIQEGMTDKLSSWGKLVSRLGLPRYFSGGTSLNGSSNLCDLYCVASEGYRQQFNQLGTNNSKLLITGIPNFDNAQSFLMNDFPYRGYVLVATSDIRETFGWENRKKFIRKAVSIAAGRMLIFKLHPNEKMSRATAEIRKYAPANTLVFSSGNVNHMVANCDELITQYSTVVYVGIALNKKVHSYFNLDHLKRLMPIQNQGASAENIASVCRKYIEFKGSAETFTSGFSFTKSIITSSCGKEPTRTKPSQIYAKDKELQTINKY